MPNELDLKHMYLEQHGQVLVMKTVQIQKNYMNQQLGNLKNLFLKFNIYITLEKEKKIQRIFGLQLIKWKMEDVMF